MCIDLQNVADPAGRLSIVSDICMHGYVYWIVRVVSDICMHVYV